jgi:hypothetical protein
MYWYRHTMPWPALNWYWYAVCQGENITISVWNFVSFQRRIRKKCYLSGPFLPTFSSSNVSSRFFLQKNYSDGRNLCEENCFAMFCSLDVWTNVKDDVVKYSLIISFSFLHILRHFVFAILDLALILSLLSRSVTPFLLRSQGRCEGHALLFHSRISPSPNRSIHRQAETQYLYKSSIIMDQRREKMTNLFFLCCTF